ncbi:DUF4916 domain-containing protein [Bradyrhizobium sp. 76]|nr:DUF4916 domain-containing protein [Bradyrhizobium sp. 76]
MAKTVTSENGWLAARRWRTIQSSVPVTCIDLLLVRKDHPKGSRQLGLIYRETPHQGRRWCLIGGRLRLNETFRAAVIRQLRETLGTAISRNLSVELQPVLAAEYLSRKARGALFDPRQHAVGLVFVVEVGADFKPRPQGEALKFGWFQEEELRGRAMLGFGQKKVVIECVRRLGLRSTLLT